MRTAAARTARQVTQGTSGAVLEIALAVLLATAGCAPTPAAPVPVMALIEAKDGTYPPTAVALATVTDVVGLQGPGISLVGGSRIVENDLDPAIANNANLTDAQRANVYLKVKGGKPHIAYLTVNGALWPQDGDGWNLVSLYYNLEQVLAFWQSEVKLPADALPPLTVYYLPDLQVGATPLYDDVLYLPELQAISVLPLSTLTAIPPALNLGMTAREVAHRLFDHFVYADAYRPEPLVTWANSISTPGINVLRSVDEAYGNFFAWGVTCSAPYGCDPHFLLASYSAPDTAARDFTTSDKCLTSALANQVASWPDGDFRGHGLDWQVGAAFAAALYQTAITTHERPALEQALLVSYNDTAPATPGLAQQLVNTLPQQSSFTLALVADTLVAHVPTGTLQTVLCGELMDRLQLPLTALPHCPSNAVSPGTCPAT